MAAPAQLGDLALGTGREQDLAPAGDLPVLTAALGDPSLRIVATRVGSPASLGIVVVNERAAVLDHTTVGDVMTRPAICVPKQTNLIDCINLMRSAGVRRVPVLDGTTVIGVLSTSDVFAKALGQ